MKRISKMLKYEFLDRAGMCFLITFVFSFFAVAGIFNQADNVINGLNDMSLLAMYTQYLLSLIFGIKIFLDLTGEKSHRILSLPMKLKKYITIRFAADILMMITATSYGVIINGIAGLFIKELKLIMSLKYFLIYSVSMAMNLAIIYAAVLIARLFIRKRIWCLVSAIGIQYILNWSAEMVLKLVGNVEGFKIYESASAAKVGAMNRFLEGVGQKLLTIFNGVQWDGSQFVFGTLVIGAQIVLIGLTLFLGTAFLEKKFEI